MQCSEQPPRVWRHWGCGRWDCGDIGGSFEGCKHTRSGTKCASPSWNCTRSSGIAAEGSFACLRGKWLDILPLCLGKTSPGVASAEWGTAAQRVRAVLFTMNISWNSETNYKPNVCEQVGSSSVCHRVSYGELLERNLWKLLGHPLQRALCAKENSPSTAIESAQICTGAFSDQLDRLRIAGVDGNATAESGSLLVYMNAVPTFAAGAEKMLGDLSAFMGALGPSGTKITAAEVWDNSGTPSASQAEWFRTSLVQIRRSSEDFGIKDAGVVNSWQFPSWHVSILPEPYIINRLVVPDWHFVSNPAHAEEAQDLLIMSLQGIEAAAVPAVCFSLAAAWLLVLLLRFCLYSVLYGSRRPWGFAQTVRAILRLGFFTDLAELGTVLITLGTAVWLSTLGGFDDAASADLRRPQSAVLLLPMLAVAALPCAALSWQIKDDDDGQRPPSPGTRAFCCRVRHQVWFASFACAITWHALAVSVVTVWALARLAGGPVGHEDRERAHEASIAACLKEQETHCNTGERQLEDFHAWRREICVQDCSDIPPLTDAVSRFEDMCCRLVAAVGPWSFVVRVLQLYIAWVLFSALKLAERNRKAAAAEFCEEPASETDAREYNKQSVPAVLNAAMLPPMPPPTETPHNDPVIATVDAAFDPEVLAKSLYDDSVGLPAKRPEVDEGKAKKGSRSSRDKLLALPPAPPPIMPAEAQHLSHGSMALETMSNSSSCSSRSSRSSKSTRSSKSPRHAGSRPGTARGDRENSGQALESDHSKGQALEYHASGLADELAGDEQLYLDFAQMIARECSRDSVRSSSTKAEDAPEVIDSLFSQAGGMRGKEAPTPKGEDRSDEEERADAASSDGHSPSKKKRYAADW